MAEINPNKTISGGNYRHIRIIQYIPIILGIEMNSVDDYIAGFPESVQEKLQLVRQTISKHAAKAEEGMAYGMPAYKLHKKPLVYFGGFAKHIGFYATPVGHEKFKIELSNYKQGKGSEQFPLSEPVPVILIAKIVAFRVAENNHRLNES